MIVQCPNCKGKGHVFDGASVLCVFAWFIAPFETNDKEGLTRNVCTHCDGRGYVKVHVSP